MTGVLETVLLVVAVVEAVVIVALGTLLARSGFRVKSLQRQLVDNRERRWLVSGKGAVRAV